MEKYLYVRHKIKFECQHLDSKGNECGKHFLLPIKDQPFMFQHVCKGFKKPKLITRKLNRRTEYQCPFGCKTACIVNKKINIKKYLNIIGRKKKKNKGTKIRPVGYKNNKKISKTKLYNRILKKNVLRLNPKNYS